MNKLKEKLDPKYLKISKYAVISALILFALCLILYHSQGFFANVWNIILTVFTPILYGAVICYILMPITRFVMRLLNGRSGEEKSWSRPVAVVLTLIFVLAVLAGVLFLLILFVHKGIQSISLDELGRLIDSIREELAQFAAGIQEKFSGLDLSADNLEGVLSGAIGKISGSLSEVLASVPKAASTVLFTFIFSIYFMLDGRRIGDYLKRVFTALVREKTRVKMVRLAKDADSVFSGYLRGKLLDALIISVVSVIAFQIAGTPFALVVGVFIGLLNLIPYVGCIVTYGVVLLAYLVGGDLSGVWIGLIILTVIQTIDAYVLSPKLLNRSITLHPLLVIAAVIGGGAVGGIGGMVLGIPVLAFFKMQFDRYIERRERMQGIAGEEAPAPEE